MKKLSSITHRIQYWLLTGYDHKFYWKYREQVVDRNNHMPKVLKFIFLIILKRMESKSNASLGTYVNQGSKFMNPPTLPHGLRGIFISDRASVGKNVIIYHQVTVGVKGGGATDEAPCIGDNCLLGAGAKIIGGITLGNNVKVGSNCVINFDVPDNTTVVLDKPRIIKK